MEDLLLILGLFAGLLQFVGYLLYVYYDDKYETIDPNPVTWFMFAYGTFLLTILEWDGDATLAELIVPIVCSVGGIFIAYRCWLKARKLDVQNWWPKDWWPADKWERYSFISDIIITIGYIAAWVLAASALLSESTRHYAVLAFLFLSNVSTFPAFYPIVSTTYKEPYREHWLPWAVWSVAYGLLCIVAYMTHDKFLHALMFYPISNALLHLMVCILALKKSEPKLIAV